jgi:hypothetical protein
MALLELQVSPDIIVEISNKIYGGTIIKRKAQVYDLRYSPMERRVLIRVLINLFALGDNDTYGEPLGNLEPFITVSKEIIADNTDIVDATTGEFLGPVTMLDPIPDPENPGQFLDPFAVGQPLEGKTIMREYDFYKTVAATQPVMLDSMIINKIIEQDSTGKL